MLEAIFLEALKQHPGGAGITESGKENDLFILEWYGPKYINFFWGDIQSWPWYPEISDVDFKYLLSSLSNNVG